jgi:hypothetical protein
MNVCYGLLVVFFCQTETPPVSDSFCSIAGPQVQQLYRLTPEELQAMSRQRKAAIAKLRRNWEKLCK